jgi:glycosyltransferase involved in cell wall biosynthesis
MRVLLVAYHKYPAYEPCGSGPHPRDYPSGSAYHLHDLLAQGLAEEGHEVFYLVKKGADQPLPAGVKLVSHHVPEADICHAIAVPSLADDTLQYATQHDKPCLLTCHMDLRIRGLDRAMAEPNWIFVSRTVARAHGSDRVVVNGISPDDYIFSQSKDDYFVYIGNMDKSKEKGLDLALSLSVKKGFRLIVAGTSGDYETIRHIAEFCAAHGAEYVGDVRGRAKAELLTAAKAVLFPSRVNEGCPLVILEALMSGTPVISSSCGGSVEIVSPEVGFLCTHYEDWERAVDRLPEISPRRCREIALEKYHYRRMARDYVKEYEIEIGREQR